MNKPHIYYITYILTVRNIPENLSTTFGQCSRGLALHTARPLKNGGAFPIFQENPSKFDSFEM